MRPSPLHLLLLITSLACAAPVDDAWKDVIALDAGPGVRPKSAAEAAQLSLAHLDKQEKALRGYIAQFPTSPQTFEAKLRLIRLLNLRAQMKGQPLPAESDRLLGELEVTASGAQRVEVDFARVTQRMRHSQGKRVTKSEREALLDAARDFQKLHPKDRRLSALLAEIATLFENTPKTKESLLREARELTQDPELKVQIADDLKRLAFLNKPLPLRFTSLSGEACKVEQWHGKAVALVFFATLSPPSLEVVREARRAVESLPGKAELVLISLDTERAPLEEFLRSSGLKAPVAWDSKSWEGPLIRALGLNSLPTVWLLDGAGILRSLDPLDDLQGELKRLTQQ